MALDTDRDKQRWLQLWRDEDTEFHQFNVSPLLQRFWSSLLLKRGSRVLVPLCGKSLDMLWLAKQGYQVVGIELSPIAVKAFFKEANLKPRKQRMGNFVRWQSGSISIWCGDYFGLSTEAIGHIDMVFDRASLTALPEDLRAAYIQKMCYLTSEDIEVFLLTVEDVDNDSCQSQQAVDLELTALYGRQFQIQLVCTELQFATPEQTFKTFHKAYRLSAHPA